MLTKQEASAYSHIGLNKLEELLRNPTCTFVLYVGKKKLIKRTEFENTSWTMLRYKTIYSFCKGNYQL